MEEIFPKESKKWKNMKQHGKVQEKVLWVSFLGKEGRLRGPIRYSPYV